ncbi:(deoxy)nucleoside triphosphate pyrophosphohydrolase [Clostridium sp. DL1XJH146]
MKKYIKVVGAIIENNNNEILCALRSPIMTLPNLWEFPGGKIEKGEEIKDAIEREIKEELDCEVKFKEVFCQHTHEYDKFIVNLITVKCSLVNSSPKASEHSKLIWLKRENLISLKWAPADIPTVEKLYKKV